MGSTKRNNLGDPRNIEEICNVLSEDIVKEEVLEDFVDQLR